ncbi:hypothetical protein ABT352_35240 [Streptosporangium sp. NPDC000563]|uniref:hypothetical protein n=1 Tax=Streptosporangium sp. NPDC000563 TaxID=3154366 RepID=UPI00332AEDEF
MSAETRTGFLGSGWTSESEPSDTAATSATSTALDPWPEDEEGSGGRVRKALLIVAAVAVVLGGTVVGVRALAGSESPADCPPAGCVAASNQPLPEADDTGLAEEPTEEPAPEDEPAEPGDETPEPEDEKARPTAAPDRPSPRRGDGGTTSTPRPTPTPKATRAPLDVDARPDDSSPTDEPGSAPEPLVVGEQTPAPAEQPLSSAGPDPAPSETTFVAPPSAGGAAITVGAGVVRESSRTYTVELVVAANENVANLTVSLPVSGEISSVRGAGWEQVDGDLVIESRKNLRAGERFVVTFTASGDAEIPASCWSEQGECSVA